MAKIKVPNYLRDLGASGWAWIQEDETGRNL
jgi:hypothetical protein